MLKYPTLNNLDPTWVSNFEKCKDHLKFLKKPIYPKFKSPEEVEKKRYSKYVKQVKRNEKTGKMYSELRRNPGKNLNKTAPKSPAGDT